MIGGCGTTPVRTEGIGKPDSPYRDCQDALRQTAPANSAAHKTNLDDHPPRFCA